MPASFSVARAACSILAKAPSPKVDALKAVRIIGKRTRQVVGFTSPQRGLQQQSCPTRARLKGVVVGVVLVADDQVDALDHEVGHVAVQIEGHRDRHRGPDDRPNACGKPALRIVGIGCDHRPVAGQKHSVDRPGCFEGIEHAPPQLGVRIGLQYRGRVPAGREQRNDFDRFVRVEDRERPGDLAFRAAERKDGVAFEEIAGRLHRFEVAGEGRERVRLAGELADGDAHGDYLYGGATE